jgi:general secretion pathway protein G
MTMPLLISLKRRPRKAAALTWGGFTLLELLVVLAIIAILTTLGVRFAAASMQKAKTAQCISKMRGLGTAILSYANEHEWQLPRSMHSAGSYGEDSWTYAVSPYLGIPTPVSMNTWPSYFESCYRCPSDTNRSVNRWSYGMNVFFELDPDGDDYTGSPATWRRLPNSSSPQRTILLAEPRSADFSDHVMSHLWSSPVAAKNGIEYKRHGDGSNYLFLDGHVETLAVSSVFTNGVNLFNPSLVK